MYKINSEDNKELLWNLMYRNNIFNNLTDDDIMNIKEIFDENIKNISLEKDNKSITELNKIIISTLINKIKKYKEDIKYSNNNQQKASFIENKLKSKEIEFNKLINIKKPNNIDFKLETDKPLGNEINNILDRTIQKRNYELNNVIKNDYNMNKVKEWLKQGGNILENENKIKIDNKIKKVSFIDKEIIRLDDIFGDNSNDNLESVSNDLLVSNDIIQSNTSVSNDLSVSNHIALSNNTSNSNDNELILKIDILNNKFDNLLNNQKKILKLLSKNIK